MKNRLYFASLRWAVYSGISFLVCLSAIFPPTRWAVILIILCYLAYCIFSIFSDYVKAEKHGNYGNRAFRMAISVNGIELIYFIFSLLVGLLVGIL